MQYDYSKRKPPIPLPHKGIDLITWERREQIVKHGFTIDKDIANNSHLELIQGALFCIDLVVPVDYGLQTYKNWPGNWSPYLKEKMILKKDIGLLTNAAAFLAAEIDRRNMEKFNLEMGKYKK